MSETNTLSEVMTAEDIVAYRSTEIKVDWSDKRLAKITRLRLISDPLFPYWDLSYCWGVLKDGTKVRVQVPFFQLRKRSLRADIIRDAKRDRVYAVGLGIFDAISTSS